MTYITLLNIALSFGGRAIFEQVGLQIEQGDRVGLVGPNGSGKSTLLKLLIGEVTPDEGEVRVARGIRVGYLPQDVHEGPAGPLLESVVDSIPGRVRLAEEARQLETALQQAPDPARQARLGEQLASVHHEIERLETQFPRHEAEKILLGLGFGIEEFGVPIARLSGGWKMRAALAGLLYGKPDLLLLDEPTNHLDIPSVRWLEQFLKDFAGAMLLVSHDREFLNRQIRRTVSFEPEGMRVYSGNYDFYLGAREEEEATLEARARNREQKVREAQRFIERFRAKATKARQAQSKIKLVKKMELVQTHRRTRTIRFTFPEAPRSGRDVLQLDGLSKGFGGKSLYRALNLRVQRGERIAVIGPNGCGKTTLLRMVAGEIRPDAGRISPGHGVSLAYFAQHQAEMLDPRKTVLEEVYQVVPQAALSFVRGVCGAFLFSGEEVDKPIGVLSGGERARVSLAKLLVRPGNFMVMDEPTNHLDIASSEKLIDALTEFQGTLLFVSHNQSFINRLATKLWDIRGGEVVEYPGNLTEYYDHLARAEAAQARAARGGQAEEAPEDPEGLPGRRGSRKDQKRERAEQRRLIQETLKPVQDNLAALEAGIARLEARQQEIEGQLADPEFFRDQARSVPLLNEYHDVREEVEALLSRWESGQQELETIKENLGVS